jgi:hypothetical protein
MGLTNYGFFTRYRHEEQSQVAFLPCAPGCRGSESDPRHCQCVCRGINHGLLLRPVRIDRPVPVPYGYNPSIPLQQLPELIPRLEEAKPKTVKDSRPFRERHTTTRRIGHSFKVAMAGRSESELNLEIMSGLRKQFSEERANMIIDESFSEYFSHDPDRNRPELYELYETGLIDNTLARRNIRWVIGRPKRR